MFSPLTMACYVCNCQNKQETVLNYPFILHDYLSCYLYIFIMTSVALKRLRRIMLPPRRRHGKDLFYERLAVAHAAYLPTPCHRYCQTKKVPALVLPKRNWLWNWLRIWIRSFPSNSLVANHGPIVQNVLLFTHSWGYNS